MTITITTNNQARDLICWHDLKLKDQQWHDYVEGEDRHSYSFFYYKDVAYYVGNFMPTPKNEPARQELNDLSKWDGYEGDSCFSGVVIRWCNDFEQVIVGRYCC